MPEHTQGQLFNDGAPRTSPERQPASRRRRRIGPSIRDPRQAQTEVLTRQLLDRTSEEVAAAAEAARTGAATAKEALITAVPPTPPEPAPLREIPESSRLIIDEARQKIRETSQGTTVDDVVVSHYSQEERETARAALASSPRPRNMDEPPPSEEDGWIEVEGDWPTPPDPR